MRRFSDGQITRIIVAGYIILAIVVCVAVVILASPARGAVIPTSEQRERNRGSSCAHASMTTMLRMVGRVKGGDWWWETYRGPESLQRLAVRARGAGLSVESTFRGDASLLDRVDCAVIDWLGRRGGRHAVVFCGFVGDVAIISDPNETNRLRCYRKNGFIAYWKRSGGRAVALKPRE